jgi:hypothetical protein
MKLNVLFLKTSATSSGSKKGKPKNFDSHWPISPLLSLRTKTYPLNVAPPS